MIVRGVQPRTRLGIVTTNQGVERPEEPHEHEGELALFAGRIDAAAMLHAGDRGFADADDRGQVEAGEPQSIGGGEGGFGDDRGRVRLGAK